jgi:hypothetical protein
VTAGIDDAKAVPLGVGENHKVGIGFVPVPGDTPGAESDQALHLGGLIGGVPGIEVEVHPGMILSRVSLRARDSPGPGLPSAGTSAAQSSATSYLGT